MAEAERLVQRFDRVRETRRSQTDEKKQRLIELLEQELKRDRSCNSESSNDSFDANLVTGSETAMRATEPAAAANSHGDWHVQRTPQARRRRAVTEFFAGALLVLLFGGPLMVLCWAMVKACDQRPDKDCI